MMWMLSGNCGYTCPYGTTAMWLLRLPDLKGCYKHCILTKSKEKNKSGRGSSGYISVHRLSQRGAQDTTYPCPDPERENMRRSCRFRSIKRWSAPRTKGRACRRYLRANNILPAMAHTDAIYEEAEAAITKAIH